MRDRFPGMTGPNVACRTLGSSAPIALKKLVLAGWTTAAIAVVAAPVRWQRLDRHREELGEFANILSGGEVELVAGAFRFVVIAAGRA